MRMPPLGIYPKWVWKQKRLEELIQTILRYNLEGFTPLPEWFTEFEELSLEIARDNEERATR